MTLARLLSSSMPGMSPAACSRLMLGRKSVIDRLAAQVHQRRRAPSAIENDANMRQRKERRRHPLVGLRAQAVQRARRPRTGPRTSADRRTRPAQNRPAQAVMARHVAQQQGDLEHHEREQDQQHRPQLARQDGGHEKAPPRAAPRGRPSPSPATSPAPRPWAADRGARRPPTAG